MWRFVAICVLCFVISTDAVNILVKDSTYKGKIKTCHQFNEINITALEGDTLTFSDEIIKDNDFIGCNKLDDPKLSLMSNFGLSITKDMGGSWRCTTRSDDGCFMNLHVKLKSSPQKVLQHNMVIPTNLAVMDEKYDHYGRAFYTDGDDINITCIVEDNTPVTRNITLKYICSGQENEVVQGQPILGNATKDCYLVCTYKYKNDFTETKVIFVSDPLDKEGYIKVNGHIARQNRTSQNGFGTKSYETNYIFSNKDRVYVFCHTETEGLVARSECGNTTENNTTVGNEVSVYLQPFKCSICDKSNNKHVQNFKVYIRKLLPEALDPINISAIDTTVSPKSSNVGNIIAIVCSVIAVLLVIYLIYAVKMWKQKRATEHNNIQQTGDQQNSVYAVPYDHTSNRGNIYTDPQPINLTLRNTNTTLSRNERVPRTEENYNSVNINQPNKEDLYTETIPKYLRPQNDNTTVPNSSYPTEFETPLYANKDEVGTGSGEELYANEKEAVFGEDLYVNEKNIGKDVHDNACQEPFYWNNEGYPSKKTKK